ncbi:unnamed protein product (macronuclear) [Paramecium tetraurelia]|uniref:Uncharacterized protein n=1 Tax=Paramecium tetraurelia TaxID=5888 RepID=A0BN00_PARTE|nr:uncharacterized protein GSPATT00030554001 [Paramecium tetraurelia]CAK59917.1 unnamed protein product [Paramecium tetraurelia]|eukprot:XP_001427315.1 hypothetical protein (macronuclear) [Paramecium tetraurelia strain d4-2]
MDYLDYQEEINQKHQTIKLLEEERDTLIQNANALQTNQIVLEKEITRQKTNIANYEAELIELHKERKSCDEQIQKSQIQIESYEQQITQLNEDLKKVTVQCDEALQQLQQIQSRHEIEIKTLLQQLMNEKEKVNEINDENLLIINNKQNEIDLLNEKLNELEKQIQSNLQNHLSEVEQLNQQIESAKQAKDEDWEQTVKILQNEIDDLNKTLYEKEQNNKTDPKIEELNQYIIEQEQQYIKQFDTQEEKMKSLQNDIGLLNSQLLELQKNNDNQLLELAALQQELQQKNENCSQLTNQIEDLKQQQQKQVISQQTQQAQAGTNNNAAEKMVTISMKELLNWDKRSKDQQNQIKALSNEIQLLKNQQEEQLKLQNSKQMKSNLSLEGMVQRCQVLQQIVDETSQQNSKIASELNTSKLQNQQLKDDLNNSQQELKELRVIVSDKFRLEGELASAHIQISENKDLMKKFNELQSNYENKEEQLETTKKTLRQSEQLRNNLQIKLDEITIQYQKTSQELANVKQERDQKNIKQKDLEKLLQSQFQEYSSLESKYKESQINYEDMQSQVKILQKKYSHVTYQSVSQETEQLKEECRQKQKLILTLEESNKSLINDLQALRELQFRQKAPEAPLTKKERIVVESLSLRVQELELENKKIKETLCAKIVLLQNELEQKTNCINQIANQVTKQVPSLSEQNQLDKEDVKMIQQLKIKLNIQEILEKTLIENLQLRDQIKVLGTEINKRK